MLIVANQPETEIAPSTVSVCQRPAGTASGRRLPPSMRPQYRVIWVVIPLSSRKIRFAASIFAHSCRQSERRRRTASVSCSEAWIDFF
jgi:hypothetical protein